MILAVEVDLFATFASLDLQVSVASQILALEPVLLFELLRV